MLDSSWRIPEAIEEDSPSTDAIRAMHRVLLREDAPEIAGELRTEPVWIGGREDSPRDALFVPPHQDQVKELLGDLEAFMARTDIPALAHAAVAHAQFETIHPFGNGNGRTGRALVHVMLKKHRLSRGTALPVSAGLLAQATTYFTALDDYRVGKVEPIVKLFAEAAVQAAEQRTWLARQLQEIQREWKARLNARGDALAWDVLPLLLRRPVLTASAVAEELHTSSPNARNALDRLSKDGIVVAANLDKRTRAWRSPDVRCLTAGLASQGGLPETGGGQHAGRAEEDLAFFRDLPGQQQREVARRGGQGSDHEFVAGQLVNALLCAADAVSYTHL